MSKILKIMVLILMLILVGVAGWWFFVKDKEVDHTFTDNYSTQATKYKDISFKVDSGWNDEAQLFIIYPITENETINNSAKEEVDGLRNKFIADVEGLKKDKANADKIYELHMSTDVNFATEELVNFVTTTTTDTVADGTSFEVSRFYDRKTGERIEIDDLFTGDDYLNELSSLSKKELKVQLGDEYNEELVAKAVTLEKDNFNDFGVASAEAVFIDFQAGDVADVDKGVVRVEINSTYAKSVSSNL